MLHHSRTLLGLLVLYFLVILGSSKRIVGGKPAKEGEFPFQVSIRRSYNDEHSCGGTVISPVHILTAAHCMYYKWGGPLPAISVSIVTGQLNLSLTDLSIYRNATKITVHSKFDTSTLENDIAVIQLNEELPIKSNKLINTVPILRKNFINNGTCYVSGWGYQEHKSLIVSEVLLVTEVSIVDRDKCRSMYEKAPSGLKKIFNENICAGNEDDGGRNSCEGDSGGPLMCDGQQTGIVSFGHNCGRADFPGVYVEIASYYDWINEQIENYVPTSEPSTSKVFTTATTSSPVANTSGLLKGRRVNIEKLEQLVTLLSKNTSNTNLPLSLIVIIIIKFVFFHIKAF